MEITKRDIEIIKLLKKHPSKATFSTDIKFSSEAFLYDKDEVARQALAVSHSAKVTYEDHISVVVTARHVLKQDTQLAIARTVLTHRFFKRYRENTFMGKGSYLEDLQFILQRIGNVYDHNTSTLITKDVSGMVKQFTEPTLVQVNHLASQVTPVKLPTSTKTLDEWASIFNKDAPESTVYVVAGNKAA